MHSSVNVTCEPLSSTHLLARGMAGAGRPPKAERRR